MTDTMRFGPNNLKAKPGQTVAVELKNTGYTIHNVFAPGLGVTSPLRADGGKTVNATFTAPSAPGIYPFWCNEPGHSEAGMNGQLTVE